jgi:hypothetical protein
MQISEEATVNRENNEHIIPTKFEGGNGVGVAPGCSFASMNIAIAIVATMIKMKWSTPILWVCGGRLYHLFMWSLLVSITWTAYMIVIIYVMF